MYEPIVGNDAANSNGESGFQNVWEVAWHQAWLIPAILAWGKGAGTPLSDSNNMPLDGGLLPLVHYYPDNAPHSEPMYPVGMVNSWLRKGLTSLEPSTWKGCSRDGIWPATNFVDCGAVPSPSIQHIPPAAGVL
jgi:hypothetical protein